MSEITITSDVTNQELNDFVKNNKYGSIFQTAEMGEVYRRNKGADPLVLVAKDNNSGDIIASLLAKILDEKPGVLGSFSRHSTIRGGPIFDGEAGLNAVPSLLKEYTRIVEKDTMYSRIYPLENTPDLFSLLKQSAYKFETWNNFLIDIAKSEEELWGALKDNKKKAIKKAEKFGLKFREIKSKDELKIFYELVYNRFCLRNNPLEDMSNFEAVYDILVPKGMAKFFFAEYDGKCIATRLSLLYNKKIYAWYCGSDNDYLKYRPNDFITWSILKWGHENGFELFDFGGGGVEEDRDAGWVQFKERFGSEMVNYGRYTSVHKPLKLKFATSAFEVYKRLV